MVRRIVNGRMVDVPDAPEGGRPVWGDLNMDGVLRLLKHPFRLPVGDFDVPGWALAVAVAVVLFHWGLLPAVALAVALHWSVVGPQLAGAAPPPPPPAAPRGNLNASFSGSSVTNTVGAGSQPSAPVDEARVREARNRRFGGIADVRTDKM